MSDSARRALYALLRTCSIDATEGWALCIETVKGSMCCPVASRADVELGRQVFLRAVDLALQHAFDGEIALRLLGEHQRVLDVDWTWRNGQMWRGPNPPANVVEDESMG